MIRYSSNKQAFIIAVIVILLCVVCLTGATLALFTSDPNDGTIGIITTSGIVDIDVVDTAGVTLQNKALTFMTPSGYVNDEEIYFEPGATFYTQGFQVANKGDIPVNFSMSVSKAEGIDAEEFNKAFDLWIVKEGEDIMSAERIEKFKVNGLPPKESSPVYFLVIRMKETADNEFQGKKYTGIGVTVFAVQGNVNIKE